jgi:serine/threonine protein kinase
MTLHKDVHAPTDGFSGHPLLVGQTPLLLTRFLDLAVGAATALESLHASGVIHKSITSTTFLVDDTTGALRLTDFRMATDLLEEPVAPGPLRRIEGNLTYISPEQTGRMNRPVDTRSDLYSLGVCFHEWLTGAPPFVADDALELVHAHVARAPRPPPRLGPTCRR